MSHSKFIIFIALLCVSQSYAQLYAPFRPSQPPKQNVWAFFIMGTDGSGSKDLRTAMLSGIQAQEAPPAMDAKKSPLTAALYSAALPGLGQSYAQDWSLSWKSMAFAGAEVSLWVIYASYIHWANNRTARFEQYADANWDVTRYVDWIIQWQSQLNAGSTWSRDQIIVNPNAANPWDRIDWTRLNQCEEEIAQAVGNGFTHRLPPRPQQQYYELIGKYPQYGGGWNDASGFTPGDILTDNVSPNFLIYRDMRGGANEMYNIARTASLVIVANHVLSALEAAWEVSRANRTVEARAELRPVMRGGGFVEFVPHVDVKLRL